MGLSRPPHFNGSRPEPANILIFGALTLLAWLNRFVLDDAFISFRYADNFARGRGLVWNAGERVEGYTNFLWTLFFSLPIRLGLDPVAVSYAIGLALFFLTLVFTYRLALLLLRRSVPGARLAVLLLGTNYTFSCYATGGMETQLQACLFVACVYLTARLMRTGESGEVRAGESGGGEGEGGGKEREEEAALSTPLVLSVLLGLSVLTRPDSLLVAAVILPPAAYLFAKGRAGRGRRLAGLCALLLPFICLVGAWLAWKTWYYGDVLPNTYYVKLGSSPSARQGLVYLYDFFAAYWLAPPLLLLLWASRKLFAKNQRPLSLPALVTVLWLAYTARAGGDFMEFRFVVPVLPFVFLLLVWAMLSVGRREISAALALLMLAGSLYHALTFTHRDGIEGVALLRDHIDGADDDWRGIGRTLGAALGHDPGVTIATTAAGAIPFYSGLRTLDMHGLNDRWVARDGILMGSRPGHQRLAPLAYMIERRVNLIVGHPWVARAGSPVPNRADSQEFAIHFFFWLPGQDKIPDDSRLLEIPLDAGRNLLALYVVRDARVDEAIRANGWRTFPVIPRGRE